MANQERWKGSHKLPPDIEQKLKGVIPLLKKEGILLAYLFGSLSKGLPGNDVDIAILAKDRPVYHLRGKLSKVLGTERIDLVDLTKASPLLCFEIVRNGHILYVADEAQQDKFEMAAIHLYRDTIALRRRQKECLKRRMEQWSSEKK